VVFENFRCNFLRIEFDGNTTMTVSVVSPHIEIISRMKASYRGAGG
jgi:hypothetical protein